MDRDNHHHAPRAGTVNETTAIVANTAMAGRTSTTKAPARMCHGAKRSSGNSSIGALG